MSALEMWRRHVLEHPEKYDALERAAAWELTAHQCEERGIHWAAKIARRRARRARARAGLSLTGRAT